ncbi:unnamed protein product [Lymnaea stagnalis]|uniref:Uncharacterized protein n=1 Tax=Lymnaea stagnalis TaxID=6523 RepID=A0AAV2I6G2_LYMST
MRVVRFPSKSVLITALILSVLMHQHLGRADDESHDDVPAGTLDDEDSREEDDDKDSDYSAPNQEETNQPNGAPGRCKYLQYLVNAGSKSGTVLAKLDCGPQSLRYSIQSVPYEAKLTSTQTGEVTLEEDLPPYIISIGYHVSVLYRENDTVFDELQLHQSLFNSTVGRKNCSQYAKEAIGNGDEKTARNIFTECPIDFEGQVSLTCTSSGRWTPNSLVNCIRRSDLERISTLTEIVFTNQHNLTDVQISEQVDAIAARLNDSVTAIAAVSSVDIKMSLCVMDRLSLTVRQANVSVPGGTFMKLASVSNELISADVETWLALANETHDEGASLLSIMDLLAASTLDTVRNESFLAMENIAVQLSYGNGDIHFPNIYQQYPSNQWFNLSGNAIFLPKTAFTGPLTYSVIEYRGVIEKFRIDPERQKRFNKERLFTLGSNVLTLTVNTQEKTIQSNVKLTFSLGNVTNDTTPYCGFLDTSASELGIWSTRGCFVESFINNTVVCSCNHLTNFAVLMSPFKVSTRRELSVISITGCIISITCLAATAIVYSVVWRHVKSDRSFLHVNLSVCLIVGYIIFLVGVEETSNRAGCTVVAVLLHYFCLTVFMTMLAEGLEIYKSVIYVFDKRSLLKILLPVIYGVPVVIVGITLAVTKWKAYTSKHLCWLPVDKGVIWAFVAPVLFILLINLGILMYIVRVMQSRKYMSNKNIEQRTRSVIRAVFMLSPILGVTWIFGVFSVNEDLVVFQYIFAILNSLQGLFVFICFCIMSPQIREGIYATRKSYRRKSIEKGKGMLSQSIFRHSEKSKDIAKEDESSSTLKASNGKQEFLQRL